MKQSGLVFPFYRLGISEFNFACRVVFFIIIGTSINVCSAQHCGTEVEIAHRSNSFSQLKFFPKEDCSPLIIKCNYIVLNRDDGTGGMDSTFIRSLKINTNIQYGAFGDALNCGLGEIHPSDANISLDYNVFYENNTEAWDYQARAQNIGTPYFDNYFDPSSLSVRWPALDNIIQQYRARYPDRINIVFVENGAQMEYYENAVANSVDIPEPWEKFDPKPQYSDIYSGVSFFPSYGYFGSSPSEFIIIGNLFTRFIGIENFGHIEIPLDTSINEFKAGVIKWNAATLMIHELGHSFGLSHRCICASNVMLSSNVNDSQGVPCAFNGDTPFLPLFQFEQMQMALATTSSRKFVDCDRLWKNNCTVETIGNEVVTQPMSIWGDLVVRSGHTLILKSEVYFSEDSTIDIELGGKLIIDGALLTTGCSFETWGGVQVLGGDINLDVLVINGSIIENTIGPAISKYPPDSNLVDISIAVYPNPFNDILNIAFEGYEDISISIVNLTGQLIYESGILDKKFTVETRTWPQGLYFIQIKNGDEIIKKKKLILAR